MISRPIRLFVSRSPGLAPEREIVGRLVADLPIEVGWEIKHTVGPGEDDREALSFVERCDFYAWCEIAYQPSRSAKASGGRPSCLFIQMQKLCNAILADRLA